MQDPQISIIIGTRDRKSSYERFIASVREHAEVPYEIIVGDASEKEPYAENCGDVRVFREKPRMGFAEGCNRCLWHARGKVCVVFNDDVEVTPGYDTAMLSFLLENEIVGCGCPYFRDYAGRNSNNPHFTIQSMYRVTVPNFPAMRREVGESLGWFDSERCSMYGSDGDLGFRTLEAGFAVVGIPGCRVLHYREWDDARERNMQEAPPDQLRFKEHWEPKAERLQELASRFPQFNQTRSIT
jgi:GT2 family glycosyltransferase